MAIFPRAAVPLLLFFSLVAATSAQETPAPDAAGRFAIARMLAEEGRLIESWSVMEGAIRLAPEEPYLHAEAARLLLRLGRIGEAIAQTEIAMRLAPDSADILRVVGRVNGSLGDHDPQASARAVAAFEQLRRLQPGDLEALVSLGQIYLRTERPAEATAVLREAEAHHPRQPMILALLADAAREAGDPETAIGALRELIPLDPTRPLVRIELADLLSNLKRFDEALAVMEELPEADRSRPEIGLRLAAARWLAGDIETAGRDVRNLLAVNPDLQGGKVLLVEILLADGRPEEAAPLVLEPFTGTRQEIGRGLRVAGVFEQSGRSEQAGEVLQRILGSLARLGKEREEDAARVGLVRGGLLLRSGRGEEALAIARAIGASASGELETAARELEHDALTALDRGDEWSTLHPDEKPEGTAEELRIESLLGTVLGDEPAVGVRKLLALLEKEPNGAEIALMAGESLQRSGRFDLSIPFLARFLESGPESARAAWVHYKLGVAHERCGAIAEAIPALRRAIELEPDFPTALNYLAYLQAERGERLEESLRMAKRAVALDQEQGAYVDTLGWVLFRLGRPAEALPYLERARRLAGDDPEILDHLGDAHLALGDAARAREFWELALAKEPEAPEPIRAKLASPPAAGAD